MLYTNRIKSRNLSLAAQITWTCSFVSEAYLTLFTRHANSYDKRNLHFPKTSSSTVIITSSLCLATMLLLCLPIWSKHTPPSPLTHTHTNKNPAHLNEARALSCFVKFDSTSMSFPPLFYASFSVTLFLALYCSYLFTYLLLTWLYNYLPGLPLWSL